MSKVHVLPEEVISKIAAGEVIDRPASVIKELLENSLDAGATSIEVNLIDGGKTSIHIKDNGHGIEQDDLDKIFLRHATSKITCSDDLFDIHSLGFRGEALYSIGAVADVSVKSKTANDDSAWEIHMRGSRKINFRPCALNGTGTDIKIKELFFNTPARKKFLKTNASEIHQVLNIFTPYVLLHKNCRFKLTHQGKTLIDVNATDNANERMAQTLNIDEKHILVVSKDSHEKQCSVDMHLGDINIKRSRRDMQFVFVNNRPVFNKNISYHMGQIYRLIMPPEEFPFFALFITVPPENVDVNIHPTKREVKIKNEHSLCSMIRMMCEKTLMNAGPGKLIKELSLENDEQSDVSNSLYRSNLSSTFMDSPSAGDYVGESSFNFHEANNSQYAYPRLREEEKEFFIPSSGLFEQQSENLQSKLEKARYIGSFLHKYILFESDKSILLVDQHAAQERIMYELFIRQMQKGQLEVQNLLTPIVMKLSPQELIIWETAKDQLDEAGISTNQFDNESIAIQSHPNMLKDIEKSVRSLLAGDNVAELDHDAIARRACRSSIMTGDKMSEAQADYQRQELIKCLDPFTCPHGRPTVIELHMDFLDKQFMRKQ